MIMRYFLFVCLFVVFQSFSWAESPLNKKSWIVHIEHPDHVPHHPSNKDPVNKTDHDGIRYPRKKLKNQLLEGV